MTLQNGKRFEIEEYDDKKKIKQKSTLTYHTMSSQIRQESISKVKKDTITMLDEYDDLGGFVKEHATVFRTENIGLRPMEFDKFSHMGVVYEMDFDMRSFDRRVYTVLDWLSDVGGLSRAISAGFGMIYGLLTFNSMQWFLVEKIFKRKLLDPALANETSSSSDD